MSIQNSPTIKVNSVTLVEGTDVTPANFVFTITLTGSTGQFDPTVDVNTADVDAEDGLDEVSGATSSFGGPFRAGPWCGQLPCLQPRCPGW